LGAVFRRAFCGPGEHPSAHPGRQRHS
jgi:hypothetical protein